MKIFKCLGCSYQNYDENMIDNICPYCGEFMEEINNEFQEFYEDFSENVSNDIIFSN